MAVEGSNMERSDFTGGQAGANVGVGWREVREEERERELRERNEVPI